MNKLMGQLKMQIRMNKMAFLYVIMMIGMSVIMMVGITSNNILQGFRYKNNTIGNKELSIVFFFAMMQILYIPFTSSASISQTMQMAIRMSSTRKNYYIGSIAFTILCDFIMTSCVIILLIFEHFLYKLVGATQSIEVFNIMQLGDLNFKLGLSIFSTYFFILIALSGVFYFLSSLGTTIFRGKSVIIVVAVFFMIIYLGVLFTPLKIHLENFLVNNMGILLYIKSLIVGISGFVLAWPFIEKLDIDRLKFK